MLAGNPLYTFCSREMNKTTGPVLDSTMLRRVGARFIDETSLFDGDTSSVFTDALGHTTEKAVPPIVAGFLPALRQMVDSGRAGGGACARHPPAERPTAAHLRTESRRTAGVRVADSTTAESQRRFRTCNTHSSAPTAVAPQWQTTSAGVCSRPRAPRGRPWRKEPARTARRRGPDADPSRSGPLAPERMLRRTSIASDTLAARKNTQASDTRLNVRSQLSKATAAALPPRSAAVACVRGVSVSTYTTMNNAWSAPHTMKVQFAAVPQAAHDEHDCEVVTHPRAAHPVPAQRDIHIIAKPGRQRDMPAPPEIRDRGRQIRPVEIDHEVKPHHFGRAPGNLGVPREIAVDLHRKEPGCDQQLQSGVLVGVRIHRIDDERNAVRDDHLLEQSRGHQLDAGDKIRVGKAMNFAELVKQVLRALDGTGHELRVEHHVQRKIRRRTFRLHAATIHLDRVAHRLERVERQADRQDDPQVLDRVVPSRRKCARAARLSLMKLKYL